MSQLTELNELGLLGLCNEDARLRFAEMIVENILEVAKQQSTQNQNIDYAQLASKLFVEIISTIVTTVNMFSNENGLKINLACTNLNERTVQREAQEVSNMVRQRLKPLTQTSQLTQGELEQPEPTTVHRPRLPTLSTQQGTSGGFGQRQTRLDLPQLSTQQGTSGGFGQRQTRLDLPQLTSQQETSSQFGQHQRRLDLPQLSTQQGTSGGFEQHQRRLDLPQLTSQQETSSQFGQHQRRLDLPQLSTQQGTSGGFEQHQRRLDLPQLTSQQETSSQFGKSVTGSKKFGATISSSGSGYQGGQGYTQELGGRSQFGTQTGQSFSTRGYTTQYTTQGGGGLELPSL